MEDKDYTSREFWGVQAVAGVVTPQLVLLALVWLPARRFPVTAQLSRDEPPTAGAHAGEGDVLHRDLPQKTPSLPGDN